MTQIGGVFSFPLLETTEEVVNTRDCPEPEQATDTPQIQYRASGGRDPSTLTTEIKINGAAEGFFYVLGDYISLNEGH